MSFFGQPSVICRTLKVSVKACLLSCFSHSLPVYYPRAMLLQCLQNQGFTMRLAVLLDSDSESHTVFTKLHLRSGCRRKHFTTSYLNLIKHLALFSLNLLLFTDRSSFCFWVGRYTQQLTYFTLLWKLLQTVLSPPKQVLDHQSLALRIPCKPFIPLNKG